MNTHSNYSFNLSLLVFFYLVLNIIMAVILGAFSNQLIFEPLGFIGILSIITFIAIILLSIHSDVFFFTFLIFIFIAFPSKVDNILPGVMYGLKGGKTIAFQLFTHIDIYLLIGIAKGLYKKKRNIIRGNLLFDLTILALIISFFINSIFKSLNVYEYLLLVTGSYQLRYLILLYFLFSLYDIQKNKYHILNGIYLSIIFLLVESSINTFLIGGTRLSSGTLNLNTLGNVTAQISLVLFVIGKRFKYLSIRYLLNFVIVIISLLISLATETRIAMISVILLGSFLFLRKWRKLGNFIAILVVFMCSIVLFYSVRWSSILPIRYQFSTLAENFDFDFSKHSLKDVVDIKWSPETTSIITRLDLYQTSLNMINENPFVGIGSNRWNYKKQDYGSNFKILINSHNGYLNVLAENGIASLLLIILLYFYPFYIANKINISKKDIDPILIFSLFNLGIAICDLSNSTINKHSIFAFLVFNSLYVIFYKEEVLDKPQNCIQE